ncbi:hypothetical protein SDIAM26S_05224 [Streptomyces diastaticus subsp. diastaticus]
MRLGGAGTGAPQDGGLVPGLAVGTGDGQGAGGVGGVGEAEQVLAGGGGEGLGGEVRGQGGDGGDGEFVALFVPVEAVLAAAAELGGEDLFDAEPGLGLGVGEVAGIAQ